MLQVAALQKELYAKKVQTELFYKTTALSLANMVSIPHGTTFHKPRIDFNTLTAYTKNTDITISDTNSNDETLVINQTPLVSFGIDEIELLEIDYTFLEPQAVKAAQQIKESLDGNFFNEILNATNANTAAITLVAGANQNAVSTWLNAKAELVNNGVDTSKLVTVVDPHSLAVIGDAALGNTFKEADMAFRRGFTGQMFGGMPVVESTLLTATTSLALATNPTANDTVTINNVVFTFVATPTTAGHVDIGGNAAASVDNLVAAINGAAGAGTTYIEVSANDRTRRLAGIVATDNTTSIGLVSRRGYRSMSSSMTAGANDFDAIIINNIVMERGAISLAIQKGINFVTKDKPLQLGTNYITWMRYGIETFQEGRDRMYRIQIVAQSAE